MPLEGKLLSALGPHTVLTCTGAILRGSVAEWRSVASARMHHTTSARGNEPVGSPSPLGLTRTSALGANFGWHSRVAVTGQERDRGGNLAGSVGCASRRRMTCRYRLGAGISVGPNGARSR